MGIGMLLAAVAVLEQAERLPPPPFTATTCIDNKFEFLHDSNLERVNFIAVGSSVTLHNVDLSVIAQRFPHLRPINAAPCHLYVDQTKFLVEFLLEGMPDVQTVLTVFSPRDFQNCNVADTEFFDRTLAGWYVFDKHYPWLVYLRAIGTAPFVSAVLAANRATPEWDEFGTMPMRARQQVELPAYLDPRCFAALRELEHGLAARNVRLLVVTFPPMPGWGQERDHRFIDEWNRGLRATLREPTTQLIDGARVGLREDDFADPLHLLWPSPTRFTSYIAEQLAVADS
ncbi:MAG: hypothetical protein DIU71_02320 [Proteobacteria bacterium]|nr:MAG: hypothetical protein DIU71_02320 [Pseudomonadota bacterium]